MAGALDSFTERLYGLAVGATGTGNKFLTKIGGVADAGTGLQCVSVANGLVAHAGGGQASGLPITATISRVITVATAADSVTLPPALPGYQIAVINAAAANSMNVFPATGEAINALGANAAFALVANKTVELFCAVAGQWHAVLSA